MDLDHLLDGLLEVELLHDHAELLSSNLGKTQHVLNVEEKKLRAGLLDAAALLHVFLDAVGFLHFGACELVADAFEQVF